MNFQSEKKTGFNPIVITGAVLVLIFLIFYFGVIMPRGTALREADIVTLKIESECKKSPAFKNVVVHTIMEGRFSRDMTIGVHISRPALTDPQKNDLQKLVNRVCTLHKWPLEKVDIVFEE